MRELGDEFCGRSWGRNCSKRILIEAGQPAENDKRLRRRLAISFHGTAHRAQPVL